jgi:hypothetical protein
VNGPGRYRATHWRVARMGSAGEAGVPEGEPLGMTFSIHVGYLADPVAACRDAGVERLNLAVRQGPDDGGALGAFVRIAWPRFRVRP